MIFSDFFHLFVCLFFVKNRIAQLKKESNVLGLGHLASELGLRIVIKLGEWSLQQPFISCKMNEIIVLESNMSQVLHIYIRFHHWHLLFSPSSSCRLQFVSHPQINLLLTGSLQGQSWLLFQRIEYQSGRGEDAESDHIIIPFFVFLPILIVNRRTVRSQSYI